MPETADHAQVPLQPAFIFLGYLLSALVLEWAVPFRIPWILLLRLIGAVIMVGGFVLAFSAIDEMRKARTSPDARRPTTALVTSGPYRFTRNPIYMGFLLVYIGLTMLAGTVWGLILSPFLVGSITHSAIRAEEAYLQRKFRDQYLPYSEHVRRWI